ncbi:MAG: hypothetical protein ABI358_13100 [Ginsengibacter sp.]
MKSNVLIIKYCKIALFISIIAILSSCSASKKTMLTPEGWVVIGETKANFIRETDVIKIYSLDKFTDIRFRVEDRAIKVSEMTIYFENGDKLTPNVDDVVEPDQYSKIINLADNGKKLDRIEFKYRTAGSILKGRGKIIVIGKAYAGF